MKTNDSAAGGDAGGDEFDSIEDGRKRKVKYRGEQLEVVPLTVGQIPSFTRAARPIIADLVASYTTQGTKKHVGLSYSMAVDWIEQHGERLAAAVAIAVGRDLEWVNGGTADEFVELLVAVLSVNIDFFVRRLLPGVQGLLAVDAQARQMLNGSGRMPSKSSSARATS